MKTLALLLTIAALLLLPTAPARAAEAFEREVLASASKWQDVVIEVPAGYVVEISVHGTWHVNDSWEKDLGAGGSPGDEAGEGYAKPGANEGCLLVKLGKSVLAFTADNQTLKLTGHGKLSFLANDEQTRKSFGKPDADGVIDESTGAGFKDNSGSLQLTIVVRKLQ